ncbi:secreted frizzled-related protein 1b [Electrophorus electricus]|uniref:Secreted frizzled-related protein 1 n=1 Tax=Electrophorus electricus TaxID=8005 RepID=A0A4W4EWM8_ELEEL|nr:secreted frizzled-related protein 1b [Electrophorus electricus]
MRTICAPKLLWLALLCAASSLRASEYEYSWKDIVYTYGKGPQCVPIPEDLQLCYSVGYSQMILPNLLGHDTLQEVKQQASSWVPLVHKHCHADTQVFLCSLFAPVCLARPVYPCRKMCESVRDSCAPIMEAFGFPWPEMLNCSKFPVDELCIATNMTDKPESSDYTPLCPVCDRGMTHILDQICVSEFAIKTRIKEVQKEGRDRKVMLEKRRRQVRLGNLKKEKMKKLVLYLKNGVDCLCQPLEHLDTSYLIVGRKVEKRYLLTGIHKWDKSSKEFKKALKKLESKNCHDTFLK